MEFLEDNLGLLIALASGLAVAAIVGSLHREASRIERRAARARRADRTALPAAPAVSPVPPATPPAPPGRLDLNRASFEELRALGLSATQAERAIAYRSTGGGFASFEDFASLPGFPRTFLAELEERVKV